MNSRVYPVELLHHRLAPVEHRFRYTTYLLGLDLGELAELDRNLWLFGYNRSQVISFFDRDHLGPEPLSLAAKLRALPGFPPGVERVLLVTAPRQFGKVFNPASFYFCYAANEQLLGVVAEVNNTFGERQAYVLTNPLEGAGGFAARYQVPKTFFVSPFNGVEGEYEFRLADPREKLDIRLRIRKAGQLVFNSWIRGEALPLDNASLTRTVLRHPLATWLTLPRIHRQAATLYFRKNLPLVTKPRPVEPLRAVPPTFWHRAALGVIRGFLEKTRVGYLEVSLPDGSLWSFGPQEGGSQARMDVLNYDLFPRLLLDGDVGFGDAYVAREVDSPDMTRLLRFLLENREALDDRRLAWTRSLGRAWQRLRHLTRSNTRAGSRRNIQAHYDLGNQHFQSFLDPTMTYSCAIFATPQDSLETAQRNKLRAVIAKADLRAEHHVLEIGCGWGSFALEAVRASGCRVTGLTLSHEQLREGRERIRQAGLEDRISLLLCDYRDAQGSYDRIVSLEMLEAVGHENFPNYFAALERLLAPQGRVILQVITVPDHSYTEYRRSCDWIQKAIFPGSLCPSLSALLAAMASHSRLTLEHAENIGAHYARTLRLWREAFQRNWKGGDQPFYRTWLYYLAYCEAGFASRNLGTHQLVLTRAQTGALP